MMYEKLHYACMVLLFLLKKESKISIVIRRQVLSATLSMSKTKDGTNNRKDYAQYSRHISQGVP